MRVKGRGMGRHPLAPLRGYAQTLCASACACMFCRCEWGIACMFTPVFMQALHNQQVQSTAVINILLMHSLQLVAWAGAASSMSDDHSVHGQLQMPLQS